MRADEYESVIECLIELIRLQNKRINQFQLLETRNQQRRSQKPGDSKLQVFMDVFDGLYGDNGSDVEEKNFVYELVKTGKFTEDEAYNYLKKAVQFAQIYERKTGVYAKA
jgi:serine/threonine protein phosphatase PrpC